MTRKDRWVWKPGDITIIPPVAPKLKVIAKNESGSIFVVALADAVVGIFTPAVIYNSASKEWSKPTFLGSAMKFIVPLIIKDYDDVLEAPDEIAVSLRTFKPV